MGAAEDGVLVVAGPEPEVILFVSPYLTYTLK